MKGQLTKVRNKSSSFSPKLTTTTKFIYFNTFCSPLPKFLFSLCIFILICKAFAFTVMLPLVKRTWAPKTCFECAQKTYFLWVLRLVLEKTKHQKCQNAVEHLIKPVSCNMYETQWFQSLLHVLPHATHPSTKKKKTYPTTTSRTTPFPPPPPHPTQKPVFTWLSLKTCLLHSLSHTHTQPYTHGK